MASVDMCQHDWPGSGCKECFPPAAATPPLATVADHNAAFDPADEALGGAFRAGFREGWIHGQSPDGIDYGDLAERFPQAVDIEPSEAWAAHRDDFFVMLPLAAIPAVGEPLPGSTSGASFQARVSPWLLACFGELIAGDREERNHRFLEEALELVQACGCTASEAHQLVDYVYGRPVGEPHQEVGGVMVTLAALCLANGLDMHADGEAELTRIWGKVEAIRAKQAAKPKHSPLPQVADDDRAAAAREELAAQYDAFGGAGDAVRLRDPHADHELYAPAIEAMLSFDTKRQASLAEALDWAIADIAGTARYDRPDQRANCVAMAQAARRAAGVLHYNAVVAAASMALMYLRTGFVECEQCGHEVKTAELDATYELADAFGLAAGSSKRVGR